MGDDINEMIQTEVQEQAKQSILERLRSYDWEKDIFGWKVKDLVIALAIMIGLLVVIWIIFFVCVAFPDLHIQAYGGVWV
jgi:hypothetical protein